MGDGVDEAAVQQAQARAAEVGIHAGAVGAVAIDQQGVLALLLEQILAIDQGDRHRHPVAGGHPDPLAGILVGLETRHRLLLEQGALAAVQVQLIGGGRRGHGGVAVAQGAGLRLRVVGEPGDIGGIVEGDLFLLAALPVDLAQPGQPLAALLQHQPVPEQGIALQQHVRIGGYHRLPAIHRALPGLVEAEVLAVLVGAHIEAAAVVIQAVFVIHLTGQEQPRRLDRRVGIDEARLAGGSAGEGDDDEIFRGGGIEADVEAVILLLVDQLVLGGIAAQLVAIDLIGQQCLGVLAHIEHRLAVVGPHQVARGVLQLVGGPGAALQIEELDLVLTAGEEVFRHRQPAVVAAHLQGPQRIELVAFGALVAVQHQAGVFLPHLAAGVDGVLLARLIAGLVAVAVLHIGHRLVLLGDAGHHLLVELVAQRLDWLEHGLGVGVFGLEIIQHLGLLPLVVTQPVVVVDPDVPVLFQGMGVLGGHRRQDGGFACRHDGLFIGMGTGHGDQTSQQQQPSGKDEHVASFAL
ncbi:hypothetical protein D3C78_802190 [compost metagenome]